MTCSMPQFDPVPWSSLFPMVQLSAPSVPTNVIEHALRQSAMELFSKAHVFERDLYVRGQAHVQDYTIEPPDGYRVHIVRQVCVGCSDLIGLTKPPCGAIPCGAYWFTPPNTLLVSGTRDDEDIVVRAILSPTQRSCFIDRDVFERYGEVVAEGALSRVLIMPKTSWYDTGAAGIMLRRFIAGIGRASNDRGREFGGPRHMRPQRFI